MPKDPSRAAPAKAPGGGRAVRVFTSEALDLLRERDEPLTALEAELSGPWEVIPLAEGGFAVTRRGDPESGVEPYARFAERHPALLVAAGLPALARGGVFRVEANEKPSGYALLRQGEEIGAFRVYAADLPPLLDAFEALLRSPEALARLLEAAGATALERAGNLLGLRLVAAGGEPAP